MPLILLIWGILYTLFGPVINRNNGLGFDGATYGTIIKDFYDILENSRMNSYQVQRIFPLFLADLVLNIFRLPVEDYFIIKFFQIYNLILLVVCTFIWNSIAKIYSLDLKYVWTGFILGFISFGIAEMTFYYPVLTDTTAFCLGFSLLYFHLKDNLAGKIFITILGAFTWPSLVYVCFLLILFPMNARFEFNFASDTDKVKKQKSLKFYIALIIPLVFFITSIYYVREYFGGLPFEDVTTPFFGRLLYVDAFLNLIFMTYLIFVFLPVRITISDTVIFLKKLFKNFKFTNLLICAVIYVLVYLMKLTFSNDAEYGTGPSFSRLIYTISIYSITKPFVYVVTSVTYFGPAFIILFFFLKHYKQHVYELGTGVYLSFILSFVLVFTSEVRLIINFLPFIILFTVLVLRGLNLKNSILIWLGIFSVILSKIYIPLYKIPADNAIFRDFFVYPNQLFFMNMYSLSKLSYAIQGSVIFIMTVFLIYKIKMSDSKSGDRS